VSETWEAKKLELEAKMWIFGNSTAFIDTCMNAGIDPALVRKITRQVIKLHKNKVRFREVIKKERGRINKNLSKGQ
jgi:hypothetical protein